jgi:hypothetical protein
MRLPWTVEFFTRACLLSSENPKADYWTDAISFIVASATALAAASNTTFLKRTHRLMMLGVLCPSSDEIVGWFYPRSAARLTQHMRRDVR